MTQGLKKEIRPATRATGQREDERPGQRRLLEPAHSSTDLLDERRRGSAWSGSRPCTDAATRPSASSTTVLGIERGVQRAGERQQRRAVGGVDRRSRARRSRGRRPARCPREESRMLRPRKATSSPSSAAASLRSGCSTRHGGHCDHQTLTTTGCRAGRRGRRRCRRGRSPVSSIGLAAVGRRDLRRHARRRRCSPCRRSRTGSEQPASASRQASPSEGERARRSRASGPVLLRGATGRERGGAVAHRDQVAGRLGVAHLHHPVVVEDDAGQRAQRALAVLGVVEVAALLQEQPRRPDRQLVGDDDGLVAARRVAGVVDGRHHPRRRSRRRARPTTA